MTDQIPGSQECILIYDGDCRLCVTAKTGLERLGRERPKQPVRFVTYQSEEASRCLGADYRAGRPDVAFLIQPDGTIQRGLEAFLPLLPGLPGGRFFLALTRIPFLKPLAILAYRLVARNRYRWFGAVTHPR